MVKEPKTADEIEQKVKDLKEKWVNLKMAAGDGSVAAKLAAQVAKKEIAKIKNKKPKDDDFFGLGIDDNNNEDNLFMNAPVLGSGSAIQSIHLKEPGRLYAESLKELARYLAARTGADPDSAQVDKFSTYLTAIFFGHHTPEKLGPKVVSELKTLAAALDSLGTGIWQYWATCWCSASKRSRPQSWMEAGGALGDWSL